MGLVATLSALVLGLLIASAKGSYDTQSTELTQMTANVVLLDRVLAHYGPETKEARELLRGAVAHVLDQMLSKDRTSSSPLEPASAGAEVLFEKIQGLSPKDDAHGSLKAQALSIAVGLAHTRWLMYEQGANSISIPMLIVLIFWLTALQITREFRTKKRNHRNFSSEQQALEWLGMAELIQ